jgi:hypothetical protein
MPNHEFVGSIWLQSMLDTAVQAVSTVIIVLDGIPITGP